MHAELHPNSPPPRLPKKCTVSVPNLSPGLLAHSCIGATA